MKSFLLFAAAFIIFLNNIIAAGIIAAGNVQVSALVPEISTSTVFEAILGGTTTVANINNTSIFFDLPPNFYTEDLELRVKSYSSSTFASQKPAPADKSFVGKTYDLDLYTLANVGITTTSLPITITMAYLDSDVADLDEDTISPYRWGTSNSSWQLISGGSLNKAANEITFTTVSFSSFVLFASALPSLPVPAPTSGGGGGFFTDFYRRILLPLLPEPERILKLIDFNDDGRCDIIDLSILLFYYDQSGPTVKRYDLNNNGVVNFTDVSILLYYWTG